MLRYFMLMLTLLLLIPIGHAQHTDCVQAATDANFIIEQAQSLLEQGNVEGANTLMAAARSALTACLEGDTQQPTLPTPAQITPPTAVPPTSAPPQPPTAVPPSSASIGTGDFTLNPPEINPEQGVAFVYFANASADIGPIDMYMGDNPTPVVAGLDFGEVTGIVLINSGNQTFTARPAGSGTSGEQLYRTTWNYLSNSTWVIVGAGVQETLSFIVEPISVLRNNYDGQARVRVINLIPGVTRVTVTDDTGRSYGDGLGWVGLRDTMVPPGTYALNMTTADNRVTSGRTYDLAANTTTTLLVTGLGTDEQPVQFLSFVTEQNSTRIRFINNTGQAVEIYKRPGNELLFERVEPGTETDFITLPSGAATFVAYEPGVGPTGRELGGLPWQLRPNRDMLISVEPGQMQVQQVTLRGTP